MSERSGTRERILDLTISVINELGEQAVRTGKIAELAEVKEPTIYHHFGNREGLIEAAQAERFVRQMREDADVLVGALEKCTSATELRTALTKFFGRRDSPEGYARRWQRMNALGAAYARPELMAQIGRTTNEVVTRTAVALSRFQRQGMIRREVDLRALVAWYIGSSLGKLFADIGESEIDVHEWETLMNNATLHLLLENPTS